MNPLNPLRGARTFQEVRSHGKRTEGKYFRFLFVSHADKKFSVSLAVVVNRRHGSAVRRNLVRRRVREAFRAAIKIRLADLPNLDLAFSIISIYKGSKTIPFGRIPFEHIRTEVTSFIDRLQVSLMDK